MRTRTRRAALTAAAALVTVAGGSGAAMTAATSPSGPSVHALAPGTGTAARNATAGNTMAVAQGSAATAGPEGSAASGTAAGSAAAPQPYIFVHDPTMGKEAGTYYLYSTGDPNGAIGNGNIQIRTSRDLRTWRYAGTVFAQKPSWITSALGNIPNLWAPDISYYGGLWHLYYAGSSFGSNNSVIGLATTPTLDPGSPQYRWTDQGLVYRSTSSDDFNAIDPSLVTGASGAKWLVLGSFWSGIRLIQLDPATGKPATASPTVYSLAQRSAPDALEGAGITYHGGYYYLIASFDFCCRGISSTYHMVVGRSASITGPYADASGTKMTDGGGTELQGTDAGMIGPGSGFVFHDGAAPELVYHYYDAFEDGDAWVQIRPLIWTSSGWPVTGEPIVPVPGEPGPPAG
jgi:arabinan endo-1,5-alpha-L-arabinosidase